MSRVLILDQPLHFNHEYYEIPAVFIHHSLCIIRFVYLNGKLYRPSLDAKQAHVLISNHVSRVTARKIMYSLRPELVPI